MPGVAELEGRGPSAYRGTEVTAMKVKDAIAELMKADPEAELTVSIGDPKDTAYTDDVSLEVTAGGRAVQLRGWVASDNEEAFAPWAHSD